VRRRSSPLCLLHLRGFADFERNCSVDGLEVGGPGVAFYDNEGKEQRYQGLPIVSRRLRKIDNPMVREVKFMKAKYPTRDSRLRYRLDPSTNYPSYIRTG